MPANRLRRKYLARLLAQIDQETAEIESLGGDLRRSHEERRIAAAQMEYRRTAVMRKNGAGLFLRSDGRS